MSMYDDMTMWIDDHPDASLQDAYKAGYLQSVENWCNQKR